MIFSTTSTLIHCNVICYTKLLTLFKLKHLFLNPNKRYVHITLEDQIQINIHQLYGFVLHFVECLECTLILKVYYIFILYNKVFNEVCV